MQAISQQEYEIAEANYIKGKSAYETSANTLEDTKLRPRLTEFCGEEVCGELPEGEPGRVDYQVGYPNKLAVGFTLPETSVDLTRTP